MTTLTFVSSQEIILPDAPRIAGLRFRNFQGESDFPGMLETIYSTRVPDHEERADTLADMTHNYSHLTNCDPYKDLLIAEVDGQMVAYSRVTWWVEEFTRDHIFQSFGFIRPEWRSKGLGRAMLHHNQRRLREIAAEIGALDKPCFFEAFASNFEEGCNALLKSEGYTPVRYGYSMVRPDLENIPDLPLPAGLEVRPVRPEQYRQVWDASNEAFRDHWGYVEQQEEDYQSWLGGKLFQPKLWQVAWDGNDANGAGTVAGMILNYIDHDENATYNRKRGWTENICVRRPYRRQGLARALLARSLKMLRDLGMTETALGVDAQNPNGALHLYESMGYQTIRTFITYRLAM